MSQWPDGDGPSCHAGESDGDKPMFLTKTEGYLGKRTTS